MSKSICGIILCLSLLIFSLIGCFSTYFFSKKKLLKKVNYIFGYLFSFIIMLIILHLFPEVYNCLGIKQLYLFLIFLVVGFVIIKVIDNYLPDHDNNKLTKNELNNNYVHIAVLTNIIFIIYNIIVGMELYNTVLVNVNSAVNLVIEFAIRNLILVFVSYILLNQDSFKKKYKLLVVSLYSISTFMGYILMMFIKTNSALVTGILFSLVIGMFLYVVINELFKKVIKNKNKKEIIVGIISGVVVVLITSLF